MILCIDVGNSHIYGGVFDSEEIRVRFRLTSKMTTSDEIGVILKNILRENGIDPGIIRKIAIGSVVPQMDYSLRAAFMKYFSLEAFILQAGVKTGLNIKYRNPLEVGADRIANAIAAVNGFPDRNIIVIDFGTATTFCAISADKSYLGGVIMPGMRLSVEALSAKTAKLPTVEIVKMESILGKATAESIQSGIYYSALGAGREIINGLTREVFNNQKPLVLGTGGFASMFEHQGLFDILVPDLVLQGLRVAALMN